MPPAVRAVGDADDSPGPATPSSEGAPGQARADRQGRPQHPQAPALLGPRLVSHVLSWELVRPTGHSRFWTSAAARILQSPHPLPTPGSSDGNRRLVTK